MKWWFKPVLVLIVVSELAAGAFAGWKLYQWRRTKVLGAVDVKNKLLNLNNLQSNLKYYTEPAASRAEVDTSPWLKENVVWTYNSDSLNSVREYTPDKPPETYRIIALGDSHTFGDHVATEDAWPKKLEDVLNAKKPCDTYDTYEVINLGVSGYDMQHEVERYRLRGAKYHPDLVIWMLNDTDFDEINELLLPIRSKYYDILAKENKNNLDRTEMIRISDQLGKEKFSQIYDEKTRLSIEDGFVNQFNELYKGSLLLATFPFTQPQYIAHMQQWTKTRAQTWFFDGLPDIYQNSDLSFQRFGDSHPTAAAHALIANAIYQYFRDSLLIGCQ